MGTILRNKFVFFVADRGHAVASVDWSVLSAEAAGRGGVSVAPAFLVVDWVRLRLRLRCDASVCFWRVVVVSLPVVGVPATHGFSDM